MTSRHSAGLRLWLVFLLLALIWGSSFLFIDVGLTHGLQPLTLVSLRLWIAVVTLSAVFRLTGSRMPGSWRDRALLGVMGVIGVALPFTLITWGQQYIDSALAAILNGLVPLFTILLASLALHDEPITVNRLVGLAVGFGGAVLLLARNLDGGVPVGNAELGLLGELAVVAASASYAGSAVFARRWLSGRPLVRDPIRGRRSLRPVEIGLAMSAVGAVITTVLAVALESGPAGPALPAVPEAWLSVAWLGMLGSAVAYLLYFRLLDAWGATRSAIVTYALPVVGIALGVVVLGEVIGIRELAGSALIIGGIALVNSRLGGRRLYGRATGPLPSTRE